MTGRRIGAAPGRGTRGERANSRAAVWTHLNAPTEVLTVDERRERDLVAELHDRGYRIAVRCRTCGSWLAAPKSVESFQGPVCRRREGGAK